MEPVDDNRLAKADVEWMSEILTIAYKEVSNGTAHVLWLLCDGTPRGIRNEVVRIADVLEACEADLKRLRNRVDDIDVPKTGKR